ncbi:hypothetical protein [Rhizobium sp. AG855]|uniref:hypothetical protein n=1 Tax=Rhizobium sp. AG855 TaxID=2183898 RepID=UPI000E717083|nr:hypothetical protein [Rhizobium sp. AG855]RKE84605.1 hypothetical protein DFO46_1375 [Rhizobium sp. AG855]
MSRVIDRGYGFGLFFIIVDEFGAKEDLAGATIEWRLAASDSSSVLLDRDASGMIVSIEASTALITLTKLETAGLAPGRYYYQLAVAPVGKESRIYDSGFLTVRARL